MILPNAPGIAEDNQRQRPAQKRSTDGAINLDIVAHLREVLGEQVASTGETNHAPLPHHVVTAEENQGDTSDDERLEHGDHFFH